MKLLVTGRQGQVAQSLAAHYAAAANAHGVEIEFLARPEFDLADPETMRRQLSMRDFDVIINAAAYTAVDMAEDDPETAHRINAVAPGILAEIAAGRGAKIIHLSTDYVFDGSGERPWREDDQTGPLGVYGRTKLEGEEAVRAMAPHNHLILRTAWVYSPFGANFVKTMLRLAGTRDEVSVVDDQFGNPTSALDIARALGRIVDLWRTKPGTEPGNGLGTTFHLAGQGDASWCDFARHIFAASAQKNGPVAKVTGIPTSGYPTRAVRPANSRLESSRFGLAFGWRPGDWRESASRVIDELLPR